MSAFVDDLGMRNQKAHANEMKRQEAIKERSFMRITHTTDRVEPETGRDFNKWSFLVMPALADKNWAFLYKPVLRADIDSEIVPGLSLVLQGNGEPY